MRCSAASQRNVTQCYAMQRNATQKQCNVMPCEVKRNAMECNVKQQAATQCDSMRRSAMPYSAAKAGVIALTKSLGKELADKNIAVNCVTPAAAKTRIFDQISQEHIDYMLSKIPRGRFIKVDELASMVSWLVSEENSYTTGAVFDLSGGRATY